MFISNLSGQNPDASIVWYALRFILCLAVLQLIFTISSFYETVSSSIAYHLVQIVQNLNILMDNNILTVQNVLIHSDNGHFLIVTDDCTGLSACITLTAALITSKGPMKRRLIYILLGLLLVQLFNTLRLLHLFSVIHFDIVSFHFYHIYLWQPLNALFLCMVFIYFAHIQGVFRKSSQEGT